MPHSEPEMGKLGHYPSAQSNTGNLRPSKWGYKKRTAYGFDCALDSACSRC